MERMKLTIGCVVGALVLSAGAGAPASAQSVEDFYKSKRLTMLVASGAGGGYDTYARVLARHYPRHVPGKPSIVVQNMAGASGLTATNFIANQAERDGSVILATYNSLTIQPLFDKKQSISIPSRSTGSAAWASWTTSA